MDQIQAFFFLNLTFGLIGKQVLVSICVNMLRNETSLILNVCRESVYENDNLSRTVNNI